MLSAFAASILDRVLGLNLPPPGRDADSRVSIEGLTCSPTGDGALRLGARRIALASLQLASGPLALEIDHLVVHQLGATVGLDTGRPQLRAWEAAEVELAGLRVQGPLLLPAVSAGSPRTAPSTAAAAAASGDGHRQGSDAGWCLAPLSEANGTLRAEILDAHLLFDAEVTVPVRQGRIDFKDATVEHVGPNSRMGVSRLGFYVDAPNGRSYLFQFPSAPVPGVDYERRGARLGPWVTERGSLQLQAFAEWLLRQGAGGQAMAITEQARRLFDRTAVSGEVRLGDGRLAGLGLQAELTGRAQGHNTARLHSESVGRALSVDLPSLLVRQAAAGPAAAQLQCDEIAGALVLRLSAEGAQLRLAAEAPQMKLARVRRHGRRAPARA